MNELEKLLVEKKTENGDKSYSSTGNNLADLLFLTPYFENHLDEVTIGTSPKEQMLAMYIRDPRFGMGRRDLGRKLLKLSKVDEKLIPLVGRYDDLYHIGTDKAVRILRTALENGDNLAKKWMPRLKGKDRKYAKALCKMWHMSEQEYRRLIKTDSTVEYKLSYAERNNGSPLNELFGKDEYSHPLVNTIDFEKVPSLAMLKYLHTFSTREDLKVRFDKYMDDVRAEKAKVNTTTANVLNAHKTVSNTRGSSTENAHRDVIGKKIVEQETLGVEMDAICILDTSGSMGWSRSYNDDSALVKATAVAHAIAMKSTYAPGQVISFSSRPKLMTIKGRTLLDQYQSMYTGDCSNTDFGAVMRLLRELKKYPEYLIVLSDMEFDQGSNHSKEETMRLFRRYGANTKIVWWNFNGRNKTVPEFDEYGNIYLSGYNIQTLKLLENKFDMSVFVDKILEDYREKLVNVLNSK